MVTDNEWLKKLEERTKYWHFRCCNCDNKLGQSLKSENEKINKIVKCSDCNEKIRIMLNIKDTQFLNDKNIIIINCYFK